MQGLLSSRILVIDDQPANVRLLLRLLRQEGYTDLHSVTDSREALTAFEQLRPDLILLDLIMSPIGGLEILEAIRKQTLPDAYLPALVLTADASVEARRLALAAGATDFLTKPLDHLEVLLRIRNLLHTRTLYLELQRHNEILEDVVRERTRKLAEQARIMDLASDALLVCDLEENILYWNKGATRLYGWSASEVIGQKAGRLLCMSASEEEEVRRWLREGGEWSGKLHQARKDGKEIVVQSRHSLVRDESGEPWVQFSVSTDITHLQLLEQQLQRTQRLESLGALASGIAHDLNNMLTPITMGIGMLKKNLAQSNCLGLLDTMELAGESGRGLVKQLITFVRGTGETRRELHLGPCLEELVSLCRKTFPRSITVDVALAPRLPSVYMDPTQLHQIVINLCINARDAMPRGGRITVSACTCDPAPETDQFQVGECAPGKYILVTVEDTGEGIPTGILPRIFEPFFTTKDPKVGTGLGLPTTANIVKNQGGFIRIRSTPEVGTRFEVYLAVVETTPRPVPWDSGSLGRMPPTGGGERILLLVGESAIREIIRSTLEASGYRVLIQEPSETCLPASGGEVRLIIADSATAGKLEGQVPTLLSIEEEGNETCQNRTDRLSKPFSAGDLLRLVRSCLDRRG